MKKILSWAIAATLILCLPSLAMAKGNKKGLVFRGKVTAVSDTSITVTHGKKNGGTTETIAVPAGTTITEKDGSPAPALNALVGKRVSVKESTPGTASAIVVRKHKKKKAA